MIKTRFEEILKETESNQNDLIRLNRENDIFKASLLLFVMGFLFNLSANIFYELIQNSPKLKFATLLVTLLLFWVSIRFFKRLFFQPINEIKSGQDKLVAEMRSSYGEESADDLKRIRGID